MRVATWNVNSVTARMPRLTPWLEQRAPDVLLVQETKATDDAWPAEEFSRLGYQSVHLGNGRWNGVAVLSRVGIDAVTVDIPGQPEFEGSVEPRAIGVTCAGVRLWTLYVPNGRKVGSPHYAYKLEFLLALRTQALAELAELGPDVPYGLLGDFNVAPADADVWDPAGLEGHTHVSAPERSAIDLLCTSDDGDTVLTDLLPRASERADDDRPPWTFWEMRMLGYQKGRGMRLDLVLANAAFRDRTRDVWVDRDARKGQGPSDHAPVMVDLA